MAKVTGPLYSMGASGKIADAMVFFPWKGVNAVRQWLKPVNKMSVKQGFVRLVLGGTGRATAEIKPTKKFAQQLIDLKLIPGGQTKQSFLVQYIRAHYITDATAFASALAEVTAHTAYAAFGAAATALGIVDFSLTYDNVATYDKALGVYLIAKSALALAFTGTPYTVPLTSWVTAQVNAMIADFTTAPT